MMLVLVDFSTSPDLSDGCLLVHMIPSVEASASTSSASSTCCRDAGAGLQRQLAAHIRILRAEIHSRQAEQRLPHRRSSSPRQGVGLVVRT